MPEIQYLGHACFRIRGRDGVVIMDPGQRASGYDIGKQSANILTISHAHADHSYRDAVRPLKETLNVFEGPGEYEVGGVLVTGVRTYHDKKKGAEQGRNVVFVVHIDDVAIAHLGDLAHELTAAQVEEIGDVDVVFIPVGGHETLHAGEAAAVIAQLEPRIVIPMHYASPHVASDIPMEGVERFLTEMGVKEITPEEKLTVTQSNLPPEGVAARVVLMQPSAPITNQLTVV